ncbi:MAG: cadherin repeat domain-containing protein, partial [Thiobacillus sp.]
LTDVNERPTIQAAALTVDENSLAGVLAGRLTATDPDAADQGKLVLTMSVWPAGSSDPFELHPASGEVRVRSPTPVLDFEGQNVFVYNTTVTDVGGLTHRATLTVTLANVNEPPVVQDAAFAVDENSAAGTFVGQVVASDPDAFTTLTYAIVAGNEGGAFAVNTATGALLVAANVLDFEDLDRYVLTVSVQDNGIPGMPTPRLTSTATLVVSVRDVND